MSFGNDDENGGSSSRSSRRSNTLRSDIEEMDLSQDVQGSGGGGGGGNASQASQKTRTPQNQSEKEKRDIRKGYRDLNTFMEKHREDFVKPGSELLNETLQKANGLFENVTSAREGLLDVRILALAGELGAQQANRLRMSGQSFDSDFMMRKLHSFMGGKGNDLDWEKLGKLVSAKTKRVPTVDFMLGPLAIVPKQSKRGPIHKLDKSKEVANVKKLKDSEIHKEEDETTANVRQVHQELTKHTKHGAVNYFMFIIHPTSFSQTVENIFYTSFLIRDGRAGVRIQDGQPMLEITTPIDPKAQNPPAKKQMIISISQPQWEELKQVYEIKKPMIPDRPTKDHSRPTQT